MWPFGRNKSAETPREEIQPYVKEEGIVELHNDGDDAVVDICFVHGLGGHRTETWSKGKCCWPRDLLPKTLSRDNIKTRIFPFGYDASPATWQPGSSSDRVYGYARSLMRALADRRGEDCDRQILLVGHSMGGLVIKCAVSQAHQRELGHPDGDIFHHAAGLVFIATPHKGSDKAAWAKYLQGVLSIAQRSLNEKLIDVLKKDTAQLQDITENFNNIAMRIPKYCCYETRSTTYCGFDLKMVVEEWSAILDSAEECEGISEDHVNICKFDNENDPNYEKVTRGIRRTANRIAKAKRQQTAAGAVQTQRGMLLLEGPESSTSSFSTQHNANYMY